MRKTLFRCFILGAVAFMPVIAAQATWSIIIIDTESKEIAIGSATCLLNFDLKRGLPVVRVGLGAAAAQSAIDGTSRNRQLIWNEFANGTDPAIILQMLAAQDPQHQSRQYGIVDTQGRAVTFTGSQDGPYANGLTGRVGNLVYSIQGNVITGQPVLNMAEQAILNTPGGLPEKLMAAMEAARAMGGDGRCSCSQANPPGCGSPPPQFNKSAHIGFMIDARRGDIDGSCSTSGCATGLYYMTFNIRTNTASAPDPVIQLRQQFDTWRQSLVGVPDTTVSRVTLMPAFLANDGQSVATMQIEVLDWQGLPAAGVQQVLVGHELNSAHSCAIGPVTPLGNSVFMVELTAGAQPGLDRFLVTVTDAVPKAYFLSPSPQLRVLAPGDLNGDGAMDFFDLDPFVLALLDPNAFQQQYPGIPSDKVGDMNQDGQFDMLDIDPFVECLLNGDCP